jgi:hypothetical protein
MATPCALPRQVEIGERNFLVNGPVGNALTPESRFAVKSKTGRSLLPVACVNARVTDKLNRHASFSDLPRVNGCSKKPQKTKGASRAAQQI